MTELLLKKADQAAKQGNNIQLKDFREQAIHQLHQALKIMEGHFPEDSAHIHRVRSKIKKIHDEERISMN